MLEYERIDISEVIDLNKSDKSKECDICYYWYFLDKNVNYEPYLSNGCHDLMQKAINFNDVAIVSIKGSDYRIHFWYMTENDAINLLNNSVLDNKGVSKWILLHIKHLLRAHLEELILETFILVLMVNGIESHGNNLTS